MPSKPSKPTKFSRSSTTQPRRADSNGKAADGAVDVNVPADLARYVEMRDFERTPEPSGLAPDVERQAPPDGPLMFVVQKHRATRLHYDVRLEVDGVLKSWPVPKGPSTDPSERRLAVMTEDHPMDYATFEGLIPKGQYGAGEVIVWDIGTYSPDEDGERKGVFAWEDREEAYRRMREMIAKGKVSVTFRGSKLKGSFALVKTNQSENSWLMLKHRDDYADPSRDLTAEDASVLSGFTIADLQGGRQPPEKQGYPTMRASELDGAKRAPLPAKLEPMQAQLADGPFTDDRWLFEPKLDGVRALVTLDDGKLSMRSRRGLEMVAQYPTLAGALGRQPATQMVIDGEIVAHDERGLPSFEQLQQRLNLTNPVEIQQADRLVPAVFYAFDLLYLDGYDLRRAPLEQRKALLRLVLTTSGWVRLVDHVERDGEAAYKAWTSLGLEGVVAKRRDSVYESGRRSAHWKKLKGTTTCDFVVGGFTPGEGSRLNAASFGALVIGAYDEQGRLVPVGRVGSGFDEKKLRDARKRLDPLVVDESPFAEAPATDKPVTFVRPDLVVEVEYREMTSDTNLRAPVFKRFRDDVDAASVRLPGSAVAEAPDTIEGSPATARSQRASEPVVAPRPAQADLATQVATVLQQLAAPRKEMTLDVGGHRLKVSNLDKPLWPATTLPNGDEQRALTKRDLLTYYASMAPVLLPHLRDRPLTMTRYPNGIEGSFFYQKHVEQLPGDYVTTVRIHSESGGADQDYVLVNNLPTLLWLGQVADLALHISLARVSPEPDGHHLSTDFTGSKAQVQRSVLNYPDFVLFDLDPYIYAGNEAKGAEPELNKRAFRKTSEVAVWLKELLDSAGLSSFVKTSGATGLHILVPVLRNVDYDVVRGVAETFGAFLLRSHPKEITMEWATDKRTGKVFFDANQNARIKSIAGPYSPRAKPGAPVSVPLRWDELERIYPTDFTMLTAPDRVAKLGDLWGHILEAKQDLRAIAGLA